MRVAGKIAVTAAAAATIIGPLMAAGAGQAAAAVQGGARAAAAAGTWQTAIEIPGTPVLNTGGNDQVNSVSCASAGNCAVGGTYSDLDSGTSQAFVADEVSGTWQSAIEVPGIATLNTGAFAGVDSVSCASAGNCSAGGYYADPSGISQAFVVNEVGGAWQSAIEVPGTAALNAGTDAQVNSVSCGSAGNCVAGGSYTDGSNHGQAFVADEVNGTWQSAIEVPGTAALNTGTNAEVNSTSCGSAGNCAVGGSYTDASSGKTQAFVADEVGGAWQSAIEVPGTGALNAGTNAAANSVSCGSAGNCAVGGSYTDGSGHGQAFVADEVSGTWQSAIEVPGTAALNAGTSAVVNSTSCGSAGNCAVGGSYTDGSGHGQAFVADEVGGAWQSAIEVPGSASLNAGGNAVVNSVSCGSAGNCSVGGSYADGSGHGQAFVADEVGGAWQSAIEVPGSADLNAGGNAGVRSVSCASAGGCAATGFYTNSTAHQQVFVVNSN